MTVVEGTVLVLRHDDGRVEVTQAPPVARVSLEHLHAADPATVKVTGRRITFGGRVVYEVTGWEAHSACLVATLVEDRRGS